MSSKGEETRNRLLDIAEQAFLERGFAATSIEGLISEAGITKGGFFYHFKGKNELAHALMQRYREQDELLFNTFFHRAGELTDDPLEQMLIFTKLFAEEMENIEGGHPGCLVASMTYESKHVNQAVRDITADLVLDWRRIFRTQFEKIHAIYTPKQEVDSDDLADLLSTILEGGIVVARALQDPPLLARQLLEYRRYIQLLYR